MTSQSPAANRSSVEALVREALYRQIARAINSYKDPNKYINMEKAGELLREGLDELRRRALKAYHLSEDMSLPDTARRLKTSRRATKDGAKIVVRKDPPAGKSGRLPEKKTQEAGIKVQEEVTPEEKDPVTADPELIATQAFAERFKDAVTFVHEQVNQNQPVIFAVGTDWMKDYERNGEFYQELNTLISATRNFCAMKGITLITVPNSELLKEIEKERGKEGKSSAKVVAVASFPKDDSAQKSCLDDILDKYSDATVIGIEDVQSREFYYSRFLEMLNAALCVAFPAVPYIGNSHIKIDKTRRFPVLIPDAEPIPQEQIERFKQFYIVQRNA